MLPINGVTVKEPMEGKAIRQLPNCLIETVFLIVPKLSRSYNNWHRSSGPPKKQNRFKYQNYLISSLRRRTLDNNCQ